MVLISPLLEELGISPEPDQSQHGHSEDATDRLPERLLLHEPLLLRHGPHRLHLSGPPGSQHDTPALGDYYDYSEPTDVCYMYLFLEFRNGLEKRMEAFNQSLKSIHVDKCT